MINNLFLLLAVIAVSVLIYWVMSQKSYKRTSSSRQYIEPEDLNPIPTIPDRALPMYVLSDLGGPYWMQQTSGNYKR